MIQPGYLIPLKVTTQISLQSESTHLLPCYLKQNKKNLKSSEVLLPFIFPSLEPSS